MIPRKDGQFSLPGLKRHAEEVITSFYLNYDKPCGKLNLGENCIKISVTSQILWLYVSAKIDRYVSYHLHLVIILAGGSATAE